MSSVSGHPVAALFSPSREKHRLLLLALGAALIFAAGIGARALWNPNEPVYGEGVREMMVRGDYFLPYVNGIIYSDKPIFYFWAMLASCRLAGGLSEAALRLPSVAAGVLLVLLVYRLGRRIFGIRAGFLGGAFLATSVMFWWHSQYIQMDQLLSLLIAGAMALFFLAPLFLLIAVAVRRDSPGPVDDEIRLDRHRPRDDPQPRPGLFHPQHGLTDDDLNAKRLVVRYQLVSESRVKPLEYLLRPVDDRDLSARTSRQPRKLKRDVAASDEHDL
mgnify:CR=1 FL=1